MTEKKKRKKKIPVYYDVARYVFALKKYDEEQTKPMTDEARHQGTDLSACI